MVTGSIINGARLGTQKLSVIFFFTICLNQFQIKYCNKNRTYYSFLNLIIEKVRIRAGEFRIWRKSAELAIGVG